MGVRTVQPAHPAQPPRQPGEQPVLVLHCSCDLYSQFLWPCRHQLRVYSYLGYESVPAEAVHFRWSIAHYRGKLGGERCASAVIFARTCMCVGVWSVNIQISLPFGLYSGPLTTAQAGSPMSNQLRIQSTFLTGISVLPRLGVRSTTLSNN